MIDITMQCGHTLRLDARQAAVAVACYCGETRVRHATAPAPRFTGVATGPLTVPQDLPAIAVDLTTKGSE